MSALGPVLEKVATNMGTAITNNPAITISTVTALLAQAVLNTLAQRYNDSQPLSTKMQTAVQLTSVALGIGIVRLIGLAFASNVILAAILVPIIIRYIGSHLFATPQDTQDTELHKVRNDLTNAQTKITALETQLQEANAEESTTSSNITPEQLGELQSELHTANAKITALETQLQEANTEKSTTSSNITLEGLNQLQSELDAAITEIQDPINKMDVWITEIQGQMHHLQAQSPQESAGKLQELREISIKLGSATTNFIKLQEEITKIQELTPKKTNDGEAQTEPDNDTHGDVSENQLAMLREELDNANARVATLEKTAADKLADNEYNKKIADLVTANVSKIQPRTADRKKHLEALGQDLTKLVYNH